MCEILDNTELGLQFGILPTTITMISQSKNYRIDKIFDSRILSYNLPVLPSSVIPGSYTLFYGNRSELRMEIVCDSVVRNYNIWYRITLQSPKGQETLFDTPHLTVKACIKPNTAEQTATARDHGPETVPYPIVTFQVQDHVNHLTLRQIWCFCYVFFSLWPEQEFIALDLKGSSARQDWLLPLCATKLVRPWPEDFEITSTRGYASTAALSRANFWQGAGPMKMGGWVPALDEHTLMDHGQTMHLDGEECLETLEMTRRRVMENVPLYVRFLPEFGVHITFFMTIQQYDVSGYDVDWVQSSKYLGFTCEWDRRPFCSVGTCNGHFDFSRTNSFEQNQIHAETGIRSIIHVSSTFTLTQFLFLINDGASELYTTVEEDEEHIDLIRSLLHCGGHILDVSR